MKPTDTPRTNQQEYTEHGEDAFLVVPSSLARELERELEQRQILRDENIRLRELVNDLLPCAIAHMAVNNGGGDEGGWHPQHRELYARAKAFLANVKAEPCTEKQPKTIL
jgi:hypothetical protein